MKVLAIDEAGRGALVGSLFVGYFVTEVDKDKQEQLNKELKSLGVKDSKQLTHNKRKEIYELLMMKYQGGVIELTAQKIDKNFFSGGNLNQLECDAVIEIIQKIQPDIMYIDALTSDAQAYGEMLKRKSDHQCTIISENKADHTYPVVGAASIIAKESRERHIDAIHKTYQIDCGSGYPADPKTKRFLEKSWKSHEQLFRHSWASYVAVTRKYEKQKSLFD